MENGIYEITPKGFMTVMSLQGVYGDALWEQLRSFCMERAGGEEGNSGEYPCLVFDNLGGSCFMVEKVEREEPT